MIRAFIILPLWCGVLSAGGCSASPGLRIRWMDITDDRLLVVVDTYRILHLWGEPPKYDSHRCYKLHYRLTGNENDGCISASSIEESAATLPMHSPCRELALRKLRAGELRHLPIHAPQLSISVQGRELVAAKIVAAEGSELRITDGERVVYSTRVPPSVDGSWGLDAWDVSFQRLLWWDGADEFRLGAWYYATGDVTASDFKLDIRRHFVQVGDRFELTRRGGEH